MEYCKEHRSEATLTIGEPYYIDYVYYSDTLPFGEGIAQAGPFRDTLYSGTGTWKVVSSTNSIFTKASGTFILKKFGMG